MRSAPFDWGPRLAGGPLFIGILNLTPDSFSDGGRYLDPHAAMAQAQRLVAAGAGMLDLGAESTRPGSAPVSEDTEWERLAPVPLQTVCIRHIKPGLDEAATAAHNLDLAHRMDRMLELRDGKLVG